MIQIVFAFWIMGKEARTVVRKLIRFPEVSWIGSAIAIPVALALVLPVARFIYDCMQWAVFAFGKVEAPYLLDYLPSPRLLLVFTLFFATGFEELVSSGVLQSVLTHKYGTFRGIFLTYLAWAAYHSYWDVNSLARGNDFYVVEELNVRIVMCLAIGYVLSWLTAQSGSSLPATPAHWLYNLAPRASARHTISSPRDHPNCNVGCRGRSVVPFLPLPVMRNPLARYNGSGG